MIETNQMEKNQVRSTPCIYSDRLSLPSQLNLEVALETVSSSQSSEDESQDSSANDSLEDQRLDQERHIDAQNLDDAREEEVK